MKDLVKVSAGATGTTTDLSFMWYKALRCEITHVCGSSCVGVLWVTLALNFNQLFLF